MSENAGDVSLGLEVVKGFAGKIIQAALGFVGTIIFARILGPTSFGGYYFLLALVYVADRPLRGMGRAVRKRYSETDAEQSEILGAILLVVAVFSVITGVAMLLVGNHLRTETNMAAAPVVFFLLVLSLGLFTTVEKALGAAGLPAKQIWNDTLRSVLTLGLQLVFVLSGFGAAGMGYGLTAASLLSVPLLLYFIGRPLAIPSHKTLRSLWDYAKYSIPGAYVGVAYNRLDILLLGFFLTTGVVGQYEVARKLTIPATLVSSAVSVAFMPKISNLASRKQSITETIENALAFNSILAIPIFFGAAAISTKIVVTIYGGEYRMAATLLVGLAAYQILFTQKEVLSSTIGGLNRPDLNLRINTGAFLFNVVIGVALLLTFGALGVVVATVVAEILAYAASLWLVKKLVPELDPFPRTLFQQTGAGVLMYVAVVGAANTISIRGWVDLLTVVGFGAAVYCAVLLVISPELRLTVRSVYTEAVN